MSDGVSKEEIDWWMSEATDYKMHRGSIHPALWNDRILALIAEVRRLQKILMMGIGINNSAEFVYLKKELQILTARLERKDEWLDFMFNEVKEFSETILSQLQSAREKSIEKELENPCKHGQHPFVCLLCWDEK
jgi:hypothetical protein